MGAQHRMRDGGAGAGQVHHGALGRLDGLAHRLGDLVRLAGGDPDPALAVADRDEGVEREAPAALDHLGHAVDGDDVLHKLARLAVAPVPPGAPLAAAPAAALPLAAAAPAAAAAAPGFAGRGLRLGALGALLGRDLVAAGTLLLALDRFRARTLLLFVCH